MRLIKVFLVGMIGLFIIITLFSLLIPSNVRVSRGVMINNTSQGEVYQQLARFGNWKKWHPIFTADSATMSVMASPIAGRDTGCFIMQRGKKVIIQMISADSGSVKFLMRANGENDVENDIVISTLTSGETVQVEWRAITKLNWYPWEKFYGIFIDQLTGPGYESALNGLKDYLE